MPRDDLIQFRGGTAAQWTTANPILDAREPGLETDTDKIKYGNGTDHWADLDYAGGGAGPDYMVLTLENGDGFNVNDSNVPNSVAYPTISAGVERVSAASFLIPDGIWEVDYRFVFDPSSVTTDRFGRITFTGGAAPASLDNVAQCQLIAGVAGNLGSNISGLTRIGGSDGSNFQLGLALASAAGGGDPVVCTSATLLLTRTAL